MAILDWKPAILVHGPWAILAWLLLVGWSVPFISRGRADEPAAGQESAQATLKAIESAWQKREAAVRTAEFIWTERRFYPKGSQTGGKLEIYGEYPAKDLRADVPGITYRMDGGKYYWESSIYLKFDDLSQDGLKFVWFYDGSPKHFLPRDPGGNPRVIILPDAAGLHGNTIQSLSVMLPFRPFSADGLAVDMGAVSLRDRTEVVDEIECVVLDEPIAEHKKVRTHYLDPRRGYLPLRCLDVYSGEIFAKIDIRYADSADYGPIPESWTVTEYMPKSAQSRIHRSWDAQVTSWSINGDMDASQLEPPYEPGTVIQDERIESRRESLFVVDADGSIRLYTDEEWEGKVAPGEGSSRSQWRGLFIKWGVVVIFALAGAWLLKRGKRARARS